MMLIRSAPGCLLRPSFQQFFRPRPRLSGRRFDRPNDDGSMHSDLDYQRKEPSGSFVFQPRTVDEDSCNSCKGIEKERGNNLRFPMRIITMKRLNGSSVESACQNILKDTLLTLDGRKRFVYTRNANKSLNLPELG